MFNELERQADQSAKPLDILVKEWVAFNYPQPGWRDDNWYSRDIPIGKCYFAHTDFRIRPVPKNQRFIDFMHDKRQEIESGLFPCASEIRAPWLEPMPEPLVQERGSERYYVLDGQLRVMRHWYHNVPNVKVFIYRGQAGV